MNVLDKDDVLNEYNHARERYNDINNILRMYVLGHSIELKGGWAEFSALQKERNILAEYMVALSQRVVICSDKE